VPLKVLIEGGKDFVASGNTAEGLREHRSTVFVGMPLLQVRSRRQTVRTNSNTEEMHFYAAQLIQAHLDGQENFCCKALTRACRGGSSRWMVSHTMSRSTLK